MDQKDRRSLAVVTLAAVLAFLGAILFSPPLFQFGYEPVSPEPVSIDRLLRTELNRATEEDLCVLSGMGPQKAKAILEYRKTHGAFTSIEQLTEIEGVSEKLLETWRPYLYIEGNGER